MEILERWERDNLRQLRQIGEAARLAVFRIGAFLNLVIFVVYVVLRTAGRVLLAAWQPPNIVRIRGPGVPPESREEFERLESRHSLKIRW